MLVHIANSEQAPYRVETKVAADTPGGLWILNSEVLEMLIYSFH